jgi:peptidoglycan hydrolase-like protein with peptidoglycan-binding domain
LIVICGALMVAAHYEWPVPVLSTDGQALARLDMSTHAGRATEMSAYTAAQGVVALQLRQGSLWPVTELSAGQKVTVKVTVKRSRLIGWLVGSTKTVELSVTTPSATPDSAMLEIPTGQSVSIHLSSPVDRVSVQGATVKSTASPTATITLTEVAGSPNSSGRFQIAVAARSWETLQSPVSMLWFEKQPYAQVSCSPAIGSSISPSQPLTLTFSRPVADILGTDYSKLSTSAQGAWQKIDDYTLSFQPSGMGFSMGQTATVTLPQAVGVGEKSQTATLKWSVKRGSTTRLEQLLAQLGYLPLGWQPSGASVASTMQAELDAATSAPDGQFSWTYANTPQELKSLWKVGDSNQILRGAIMTFENTHGLDVDGTAGENVWAALIADAIAGKRTSRAYSYVYVHKSLPQHVYLWSGGSVIFSSLCNTGIAEAPTAAGTFIVYEHLSSGTMHGTNPDGTKYNDPGVRYISYFNGGDALHAFSRGSYGWPQSLGCVEMPLSSAAKVWPYTPIGTLVTVEE